MVFSQLILLLFHTYTSFSLPFYENNNNSAWLLSDPFVVIKHQMLSLPQHLMSINVTENNEEQKWHYIYYDIPVTDEQFISATANIRLVKLEDSIGAGITLIFIDAQGKRIDYIEERLTEPTHDFVPIKLFGKVPKGTARIRISIFIHNRGILETYDPIVSTPFCINQEKDEIVLYLHKKPLKTKLLGFGAEDDGRFYDNNNGNNGVDKEGIEIRKQRINEIKPHWVRTFVWFKDWDPNDDAKNFSFNTDGMLSLCTTIEEYQRLKTDVNITCVNWGMPDAWEDVEKRANSIVALLEYLIKNKRFDNIKYFTLTNEPNYFFYTKENRFDTFVKLHQILKEKFEREHLPLQIVGSDDAMGTDWFLKCLTNKHYKSCIDLWASHFYWHYNTTYFTEELLDNRLELLNKYIQNNNKRIYTITEFGVIDHRFAPPSINPIMQEYKGALFSMALLIGGLNQGVAGYSIWCLQEVRYPGLQEPMRIGLWGYRDKNWQVFPIYYAMRLFTNNTSPGDRIYPIRSSNNIFFKAVRIDNNIFWVNLMERPTKIKFNRKIEIKSVVFYESKNENTIDITEKNEIPKENKYIFVPPKSFGVIKLY